MTVKQTKAQKKKALEEAAKAAHTPKNHFHVAALLISGKKKRPVDFQVATEAASLKLADVAAMKHHAREQIPADEREGVTEVVIQNIIYLGHMSQADFSPQQSEAVPA